MKATELMIGDWVLAQFIDVNRCAKISAICVDCAVVALAHSNYGHDYDSICPVPLTEEILKANGFVENKGSWRLRSDLFMLNEFIDGGYCAPAFYEQVFINNVHELQHALRICGLHEVADNFIIAPK